MTKIQIKTDVCVRCGRCVTVCPVSIFVPRTRQTPLVEREQSCIQCGHCIDACLGDAIIHDSFPAQCVFQTNSELLPRPEQLLELIRNRRSNRTITRREIPGDVLKDVLEAARYAPTAENTRRVVVTVLSEAAVLQELEDATMRFFLRLSKVLMSPLLQPLTKRLLPDLYNEAPELVRFERRWRAGERPCSCNAKMMLIFSAPAGYGFLKEDTNLAYQNASLMAEAHGLTQIYMGLVQTATRFMGKAKVQRLLHLPQGHRVGAMMALGIPAFKYHRYTRR